MANSKYLCSTLEIWLIKPKSIDYIATQPKGIYVNWVDEIIRPWTRIIHLASSQEKLKYVNIEL